MARKGNLRLGGNSAGPDQVNLPPKRLDGLTFSPGPLLQRKAREFYYNDDLVAHYAAARLLKVLCENPGLDAATDQSAMHLYTIYSEARASRTSCETTPTVLLAIT